MLPPPTPVVHYPSLRTMLRTVLRSLDRHTLWAFNAQRELRSR